MSDTSSYTSLAALSISILSLSWQIIQYAKQRSTDVKVLVENKSGSISVAIKNLEGAVILTQVGVLEYKAGRIKNSKILSEEFSVLGRGEVRVLSDVLILPRDAPKQDGALKVFVCVEGGRKFYSRMIAGAGLGNCA